MSLQNQFCPHCGGIILETDEQCPTCKSRVFYTRPALGNDGLPSTISKRRILWAGLSIFLLYLLMRGIINQYAIVSGGSAKPTMDPVYINVAPPVPLLNTPTPLAESARVSTNSKPTKALATPTKVFLAPFAHQPAQILSLFEDDSVRQQSWVLKNAYWNDDRLELAYSGSGIASAASVDKFDNFLLSFTTKWLSGGLIGEWGVDIRYTNPDNYLGFFVRKDGRFEIGKRSDGKFLSLRQGTLKSGGSNMESLKFHVEARGNRFRFFADDTFIAELEDSDHAVGNIVLIATNGEVPFRVEFSELILSRHP